jgi:hypothetical protein
VLFAFSFAVNALAEDNKQISIDSLLGKYEGNMQTYNIHYPKDNDYQTEIVSVDKEANTLSLKAYCQKCEVKEWKRNNCKITEIKDSINFVCKGTYADEKYTFTEGNLKATGFGKKYPYSISAKKVDK